MLDRRKTAIRMSANHRTGTPHQRGSRVLVKATFDQSFPFATAPDFGSVLAVDDKYRSVIRPGD